jgi:IMP dehydrogenase
MSYLGARTIKELRERAVFVRITEAGYRESLPHDVERVT